MYRGSSFVKQIFDIKCASSHFAQCLKKVKLLSAEDGICKAELKIDEDHLNLAGTLHGGFISTLVDCTSAFALLSDKSQRTGYSLNLNIRFLRKAGMNDEILIEAKTVKTGGTAAFVEVDLTMKNTGDLIAKGTLISHLGDSN